MWSPAEGAGARLELEELEKDLLGMIRRGSMPMKRHRMRHDSETEIVFTYEPKE